MCVIGEHPFHFHGHAFWIVATSDYPTAELKYAGQYLRRKQFTSIAQCHVTLCQHVRNMDAKANAYRSLFRVPVTHTHPCLIPLTPVAFDLSSLVRFFLSFR